MFSSSIESSGYLSIIYLFITVVSKIVRNSVPFSQHGGIAK